MTGPILGAAYPLTTSAVVDSKNNLTDQSFDEYSDLDLVLFTTGRNRYVADSKWLEAIAEVWLAGLDKTDAGDPEWFVLFSGGLKVDIIFVSVGEDTDLVHLIGASPYNGAFEKGMRIIYAAPDSSPLNRQRPSAIVVSVSTQEADFQNRLSLALMTVVKAAMLLKRGELFSGLTVLDCQVRPRMRELIEIRTWVTGGDERASRIQHRFLEKWVDPGVLVELVKTCSNYDAGEIRQAHLASTSLISRLATEVAGVKEFTFPNRGQARTLA